MIVVGDGLCDGDGERAYTALPHKIVVNRLEANKERFRPEGFDRIQPHSIRSLEFNQKVRPLCFQPEKSDLFTATRLCDGEGECAYTVYDPIVGEEKYLIYFKRFARAKTGYRTICRGQGHFVTSHWGDKMASVT